MKKNFVFIDSNVWFSAFYKEGICSKILRLIIKFKWHIVISELVLEEIIRNVKEKIPTVLPLVITYLDTLSPAVVKNPSLDVVKQYRGWAKLHDLPILVSAIEYGCTYFVTGNIQDFNENQIRLKSDLKIIAPSLFLKCISSQSLSS